MFLQGEIESQLSKNGIGMLGSGIYSLANIANAASIIQFSILEEVSIAPGLIDILENAKNDLESIVNNFSEFDSDWDYCRESKVLFNNAIPVYSSTGRVEYKNAFGLFNLFIETVSAIKAKYFINEARNNTFKDDSKVEYLVFAAFGKTSEFLLNILNQISKCEREKAQMINLIKLQLISVGVAILVMCGCLLAVISYLINVQHLRVWSVIMEVLRGSKSFISACRIRLKKSHRKLNLLKDAHEDLNIGSIEKSLSRLNIGKRFLWRILVFLLLYSAYYIISNYIYYNGFQLLLENRTKVLLNLATTRRLLTTMHFWSEANVMNNTIGPSTYSPEFLPINTDYKEDLSATIFELRQRMALMKNDRFKELLGQSVTDSILYSESNADYLALWSGTYSATYSVIFDAYYIASSNYTKTEPEVRRFNDAITILGIKNEEAFASVKSNSKFFIENLFESYIVFGVLYSTLVLGYFIVGFNLFLRLQFRKLKSIKFIMKTISEKVFLLDNK